MESGQNWTITNDEEWKKVEKVFCEMKNPVSVEQSDPCDNPFYIKGMLVFLVVRYGISMASLHFYWKKKCQAVKCEPVYLYAHIGDCYICHTHTHTRTLSKLNWTH